VALFLSHTQHTCNVHTHATHTPTHTHTHTFTHTVLFTHATCSQGQFDVEDTNNRDLRRKEAASNTLRTKRSSSFSYEIKESVSSFSCILYHSSYVLLISSPLTYTKRMNRIPISLGMKIQHSLVSTFSFSNDKPETNCC